MVKPLTCCQWSNRGGRSGNHVGQRGRWSGSWSWSWSCTRSHHEPRSIPGDPDVDPGSERRRLSYIKSAKGPKLTEFWEKEARLRWKPVGVLLAHTYEEVVEKTSKALLQLVNKNRAIINLLRMEQATRGFMEFLSDVEEQEYLTRQGNAITGDNLKRMGILAGL